jgi:membrane protein implicated in regulation of membrane protease activity
MAQMAILNDRRRLETSLKMVSTVGIIVFTIIGVTIYLLTFLGIAFTTPNAMSTWKFLVDGIGGAIIVGVFIIAILRLFRRVLMKQVQKNKPINLVD